MGFTFISFEVVKNTRYQPSGRPRGKASNSKNCATKLLT